jgi:hypothetical protein
MLQIGDPAPGFLLSDLDGYPHRLRDYHGRIVILNFWSAECPWVERVDRELLSYTQGWGGGTVLVPIAANLTEDKELIAASARSRGLGWMLRADQASLEAYGVQTTPQLFVIDALGLLRYRGAFDDVTFRQRTPSRFYLKDAVEKLLAGQSPDPAETTPYGCAVVRYFPDSC